MAGPREITFAEALLAATEKVLTDDERVVVVGLGVPDPKAIFNTTAGLREKFGRSRVLDAPISENALTGMVIGGALVGLKPILVHQRVDFALLSLEQLFNQAAKWHYMFDAHGGKVPMVVRMIVGRGWGQGPQHAQGLYSMFAHIPGLRVLAPSTPNEAMGCLISAVRDPNPVVILEHRWVHGLKGSITDGADGLDLNSARIARPGNDLTITAFSYGLIEALRAAAFLSETAGVEAEVVDLRTLNPLDWDAIEASLRKTGRLLAVEEDHRSCGVAAELVARAAESDVPWRARPKRLALPDCPSPSSRSLARAYYFTAREIVAKSLEIMEADTSVLASYPEEEHYDVPSSVFTGPF